MNAQLKPSLYEQLLSLPEHVSGEILNGELHTMPRPKRRHRVAASVLGMRVGPPFHFGEGGPGGWWILIEPEVHFVRDTEVAVPDLAGWRRERMAAIPDDHRFEVAPDWICEILSPATAKKDRVVKLPDLCPPRRRPCLDHRSRCANLGGVRLAGRPLAIDCHAQRRRPRAVPPFEAVTFSLADLWA
jgi:hypothetical protein